jgi:hypothetical protein
MKKRCAGQLIEREVETSLWMLASASMTGKGESLKKFSVTLAEARVHSELFVIRDPHKSNRAAVADFGVSNIFPQAARYFLLHNRTRVALASHRLLAGCGHKWVVRLDGYDYDDSGG